MAIFIQTLYYTWGAQRSFLTTLFLIGLAFKLSFRSEYNSAPDYLTRSYPTYNLPFSGPFSEFFNSYFGFLKSVPDNACVRSIHGSDLTFDYIIVGAGAAGSVIASRLSEEENLRILLVEAGGDLVVESVSPQTAPFGVANSRVWKFNAEVSDTACQGYTDGCPMPAGKQLGGSTGTNALMWVCGQNSDYDKWEADTGYSEWGYENILGAIKRTEKNTDTSKDKDFHGFNGKLTVSTNIYIDWFIDVIKRGCKVLGYDFNGDYNKPGSYIGVYDIQSSKENGERKSSYLAFIEPIKNKKNLFIAKNGLVTNILFNGNIATGVNVKTDHSKCSNIKFYAKNEIIISAGSLNSPKILLQSGIGPKEDLENLGIEVVFNSPGVGKNYHDHIFVTHFLRIKPKAKAQTVSYLLRSSFEYYLFGTGYFSHFSTLNMNLFINSNDDPSNADIQFIFARADKKQIDFDVALSNYGLKPEYVAKLKKANNEAETVQVFTALLKPKSRGQVELRDKDPSSKPKITPNFFSEPEDEEAMLKAIKKLRALVLTQPFKDFSAEIIKFDIPECDKFEYETEDYDKCYLKYLTAVLWHYAGTCKMGPDTDPQAVVDPTLKVYGIERLRVADASVMSEITAGNLQCPTMAIGQIASDFILAAWSLP